MILLSLAIAASAPVALGALGAGTRVRVSPGMGGIRTNFALRFSIPDATGTTGSVDVPAVRGRAAVLGRFRFMVAQPKKTTRAG